MGNSSDMESLRTFANQLWKYMEPKINAKLSSNVSYFRAQVVSNPGNNKLEVQRPVESGTLTLPCATAMSGAQVGQQVTVLVMGSLSNAVVVADGKMDVSKFLYITAGQKSGTTLGTKATAEGYNVTANGAASHAEGEETVASAKCAHAEGTGTIASTENQHVFGKYNVSNDRAVEIVGWGTNTHDRKDIRSMNKAGDMWIAGTLTQASDARLKDVQGEIPDVSSIRAVRFKWNDTNGEHDDKDHIGYIAQEVEKIAPYLVGDDSNGYKSLDYIALLCAKVEMLEREIEKLKGR